MKKIYLLFVLFCFCTSLFSQTLFTYGNSAVDKEEFLRAYNKNKNPVTDKEKSLREYLELYTKFKLKVKAAQDMRLDTLQQLQYDLQNFKSQIDESYMNDDKALNQLVDEAFVRSQKDIHVLHFFIRIDSNMKPADTANAYKALNELKNKLNEATANVDDLVKEISKKYLPVKQSDIGFLTVFSLSYEYENIIYGLKTGEASVPYRAKNGLHIFKVIGERKSAGRWKIAQILLAFPPGDQSQYMNALQQKADSIYTALQNGADFSTLAKLYSNDRLSYQSGGELAEFGTGKFEVPFETEVFKLTKDGEISKPFTSPFGIHIVKKLSQSFTPTDKSNVNYIYSLKQRVLEDSRINGIKENFVKEKMKQIGFKKNPAVKDVEWFRYADSVAHLDADIAIKKYPVNDKVVLSFTKSSVKGIDWLKFVRDYNSNHEYEKRETNAVLMDKFISASVLDYYKKHLEEYNADFRNQMEEFREGNILFEVMERKIWGAAGNDSVGLLKQYNENKKIYLWAPSASVILFNCSKSSIANETIAALKSGKNWRKIVEEGKENIQADSGRYEISQLPLPANTKAAAGLITEPNINKSDGSASFIYVVNVYEGGLQRSFAEARGLVINDYQNVLEEKWIEELKKKYPVKVNEAVFMSMLK